MKILKNFTDGLAILLAVLIMIYCLSLYAKFDPDETKIENGETKLGLFLDNSQSNKDLVRMAFAMTFSALCGIVLRKRPEFGIASSLVALAYILVLKSNGSLTKYPNVIIILGFCHAAGAIIYAGAEDLKKKRNSCVRGGIISSALALCVSAYTAYYLSILDKANEVFEYLSENRVEMPMKYKVIPGFAQLIQRKVETEGNVEASDIMYSLGRSVKLSNMMTKFVNSLESEQLGSYLRLCILLFAVIILTVALWKKFRFITAAISAVPFVYSIIMLQSDKLSTLAMPILVFTLAAGILGFVSFEHSGQESVEKYEHTANAEEAAEEAAEKSDGDEDSEEEELYYT